MSILEMLLFYHLSRESKLSYYCSAIHFNIEQRPNWISLFLVRGLFCLFKFPPLLTQWYGAQQKEHCSLYNLYFNLRSVQCTVYTVHCTLFWEHGALLQYPLLKDTVTHKIFHNLISSHAVCRCR